MIALCGPIFVEVMHGYYPSRDRGAESQNQRKSAPNYNRFREDTTMKKPRRDSYIRLPKLLLQEISKGKLSRDAVLLYGLLRDRLALSAKNGEAWQLPDGTHYVIYSLESIQKDMRIGHDKASTLLHELEICRLIIRKRRGGHLADQIVVRPWPGVDFSAPVDAQIQRPGVRKKKSTESGKTARNNTEHINTEYSDTEFIRRWLAFELPADDLDSQ